jgi:hypothetical protein
LTPAAPLPAATSGWGAAEREREPFCPSPSILNLVASDGSTAEGGRELGLSGAPHSSQYCAPSRFSVLHRSHVIIVLEICDKRPNRDKFSICARELSYRTAGHSSAKVIYSPTRRLSRTIGTDWGDSPPVLDLAGVPSPRPKRRLRRGYLKLFSGFWRKS